MLFQYTSFENWELPCLFSHWLFENKGVNCCCFCQFLHPCHGIPLLKLIRLSWNCMDAQLRINNNKQDDLWSFSKLVFFLQKLSCNKFKICSHSMLMLSLCKLFMTFDVLQLSKIVLQILFFSTYVVIIQNTKGLWKIEWCS